MVVAPGYTVENEHDLSISKLHARTLEDIKAILKPLRCGHVSVIRNRDKVQIYAGSVDKARWRFGL